MRRIKKAKGTSRRVRKKKAVIRVTSPGTGLVHHFDDIEVGERLAKVFRNKYEAKQKADLVTAASFDSFISKQSIKMRPDLRLNFPIYRVVPPNRNPLSIAGSLADGGRFNIGGAQVTQLLPHLGKWGAIYAGSTLNCALGEAQRPLGLIQEYELSLNRKEWVLWDLKKVIAELNFPNLDQIIKDTPVDAVWSYQKVPKPSQILAHYLKQIGGDGIAFESTKVAGTLNLALFFTDDDSAKQHFTAKLLLA